MAIITLQDFFKAANDGDLEVVKKYGKQGGDLHLNGDKALLLSIMNGHLNIINFLIQSGEDTQAKYNRALVQSATTGRLAIVKFLFENGANIQADDNAALRWSAMQGQLKVVQYLAQHGADVSVGLRSAQNQPLVLSWLEDYHRMQQERAILLQETAPPLTLLKMKRF